MHADMHANMRTHTYTVEQKECSEGAGGGGGGQIVICTKERTSVRQRLLFREERIVLSDRESIYISIIYSGAVHCKPGVQIRETVETMLVSVVPVDFEYFCL